MEIGCGAGNFFIPLIEKFPNLKVYACDFSGEALELIRKRNGFDEKRIELILADITKQPINRIADVISCIFVFSAIHPSDFYTTALNISQCMHLNSILLFRDYSIDDQAQKRFDASRQLDSKLYVRQDGTFAYYFEMDELKSIFEQVGLKCIQVEIVDRVTSNVKEKVQVERKFIQAKFCKRIKEEQIEMEIEKLKITE